MLARTGLGRPASRHCLLFKCALPHFVCCEHVCSSVEATVSHLPPRRTLVWHKRFIRFVSLNRTFSETDTLGSVGMAGCPEVFSKHKYKKYRRRKDFISHCFPSRNQL